uniref:hypothetical protein n=1 Tax=Faecalibacterium sp. TaxID=1971605 RepID=UPI0040258C58
HLTVNQGVACSSQARGATKAMFFGTLPFLFAVPHVSEVLIFHIFFISHDFLKKKFLKMLSYCGILHISCNACAYKLCRHCKPEI